MLLFQRMLLLWSATPSQASRQYWAAKLSLQASRRYWAAKPPLQTSRRIEQRNLLCSEVSVMPIQLHNACFTASDSRWSKSLRRPKIGFKFDCLVLSELDKIVLQLYRWNEWWWSEVWGYMLAAEFETICLSSHARFLQNKSSNSKHVDLAINEMICQWSEYRPMNAFIGQYLFIDERTTLIGQCSSLANQRAQGPSQVCMVVLSPREFFNSHISSENQSLLWLKPEILQSSHFRCCTDYLYRKIDNATKLQITLIFQREIIGYLRSLN